jgi:integrase/recombinase XerD
MVKRQLKKAVLPLQIYDHSFRATGIATFLEAGGQPETVERIAGHVDSRATKGYDRRATRS